MKYMTNHLVAIAGEEVLRRTLEVDEGLNCECLCKTCSDLTVVL